MADIRCPNCGKTNPDFLDVCQFCQTPLKPESTLHIGEKPTKKNTGELETVLPEWLRDVRQQARDSAEEDAAHASSMPKSRKDEPPDLLAGLAFQSESSDEEEVPDWLARLNSTTKKETPAAPAPAAPETDFFAQFNKSEPAPKNEPEPPSRMSGQSQESPERDELTDWFTKASEEPAEPVSLEPDLSPIDSGWGIQPEAYRAPEPEAPKEEEDLSWLHNLEAEAKKTGELPAPKQEDWFAEFGTPSAPAEASGQEDLSWLNTLGGLPASEEPAPQPSEQREDLSWLNNLGALPPADQPAQPPSKPNEDLSWLNDLGALPASEQPAEQTPESKQDLSWLDSLSGTPIPEQPSQPLQPSEPASTPAASQDDLSWLNEIGATPSAPSSSTPPASEDDLSWLSNLQGGSEPLSATPFSEPAKEEPPEVSPFTPRRTAPLHPEEEDTSVPDWLKSATEGPSMPVNVGQLDQFREDFVPAAPDEPFSWKNFVPEAKMEEEETPPSTPEPVADSSQGAFVETNLFAPVQDSSTLSNQEVDSLFSVDMPDWLSRPEPEPAEKPQEDIGIHAEGGEALSPVDLPSWVQAMRPVEAAISETAAVEDQPAEREGPLKGFRGVLPVVPIGSSRRPQPIPLKLQASAEQQASAAIIEQILASETSPRALLSAPTFASQRMLRLTIAIMIWVVLSAVIFMRTQFLPVSPVLAPEADAASKAVELIPDNSSVLIVVDYEPSLAGEMEASTGPLLNDLASLRHPNLLFISTSPNGSGLVDRLVRNTLTNNADGVAYQEGQNYFNLGYLPGGESGVLAFVQSLQEVMPAQSDKTPAVFSGYAAVVLLTDHADSARAWIEQLQTAKQADPTIVNQPLLVVSSAQAGPMLQPYVGSRQINGLVNGLTDAARFEASKSRPGTARSYWDAFGVGIILAIALIVLGSLWSLFAGMRARRAESGEG